MRRSQQATKTFTYRELCTLMEALKWHSARLRRCMAGARSEYVRAMYRERADDAQRLFDRIYQLGMSLGQGQKETL